MNNPAEYLNFFRTRKLPVILQSETTECGLACIAMIANYYGNKADLNNLRRIYSISLKGSTLKGLMDLAERLDFTTRPIKLDLESLPQLQTPCILHWDLNHFVVLEKVKGNRLYIHDPAVGARTLTLAEASRSFTGVALELQPTARFQKQEAPEKIKLSTLWSSISGLRKTLINIFLLSISLQIFVIASPFYMQLVIDDVLVTRDLDLLIILGIGFSLLLALEGITTALRSFIILIMSNQLSVQMSANLVRHLFKLPMDFFEKRHIGDIMSRFGSLNQINQLITTTLVESLVDSLMLIGLLIVMFIYSPMLTSIVIAASLIYLIIRISLYQSLKDINREKIVASARKDTNLMESVRGIQTIKLFGKELDRLALFSNLNVDTANASIRVEKLRILFTWSNGFLFGLENIIVIYIAAKAVMDGDFSVGMIFGFIAYKRQLETKVANLIDKFIEYKMISLHLERLGDIALTEQEKFFGHPADDYALTGQLQIKDLNFRYSEEDEYLFTNLNFLAEPGESIAIIGPSGCGKSTLMKIMLGLLQPSTGKILADGKDILQSGLSNYRNHIACVMQNERLMSGSILDNICFFDNIPDREHIEYCAMQAGIHREILAMPMGYHSLIGDMGSSLSAGQIQRLILARALYRRPKILFLDEATSNLDVKTETYINNSVRSLNITRIFIAHRPETIRSADRIYKLAQGELLEVEKAELKPLTAV